MNDPSEFENIQHRLDEMEKEVGQLRARLKQLSSAPKIEEPAPVQAPTRAIPPPLPKTPKPSVTPPEPEVKPKPQGSTPPPSPTRAPAKKPSESQVGAWWATRLGALFAVICVVFFAVYVSQSAGPWLRFIELLGLSIGVTVAGLWLERKYPRYGTVLFGSGLALLYFTAYAAYSLPPVKVIHNPHLGTAVQFLAVFLMVGCAFWRNSSTVATMAIFFGYAAAFFSFSAGLTDYALTSSLLLGCGAAYFYVKRRWSLAFIVAIPLAYLVYLAVAIDWVLDSSTTFQESMGYLLGHMLLFGATDVAALRCGTCMDSPRRPVVQIFNTSAALILGFLVTGTLFFDQLSTFYFLFGGVLLAAGMGYYVAGYRDTVMQTYLVKASGLIALGLVVVYAGWTRWMALLVQSGVLLASARRTRLWVMEVLTGLVWLVSLGTFIHFIHEGGFMETPASMFNREGLLSLGYLLTSTLILCLYTQWLGRPSSPEKEVRSGELTPRSLSHAVYGIALGLAAILVSRSFGLGPETTYLPSILSVLLVLGGIKIRNALPIIAALFPLFYAHSTVWFMDPAWKSMPSIWSAGLAPVVATLVLAWVSYGQGRRQHEPSTRPAYVALDTLLHLAWIGTLHTLLYKTFPANPYLMASASTAIALLLLARVTPFPSLPALSALPLVLGWVYVLQDSALVAGPERVFALEPYRSGAALAALVYVALFSASPSFAKRLGPLSKNNAHQWFHTGVLGLYLWHAIFTQVPMDVALFVYTLAAFLLLALGRFTGSKPAAIIGEMFILLMVLTFFGEVTNNPSYLGTTGLKWTLGAAVLAMAFTLRVRHALPTLSSKYDTVLRWVNSTWVLFMVFKVFTLVEGVWVNYITVSWGFSAIALFLVGLWNRSKPLRFVGLIGLACCIPRVFIVDILSTLHRIAAFGVLGVVLLMVGFLYHKYRHLIDPEDTEEPSKTTH